MIANELIKIKVLVDFLKSDSLNSIADDEIKKVYCLGLIADAIGYAYEEFISSNKRTAIVMNYFYQISILFAQVDDLYITPYSTHPKNSFKHYSDFVLSVALGTNYDIHIKKLVLGIESFLQEKDPRMEKAEKMNKL